MADLSAPVLSTMEMVDYCLEKLLDAKSAPPGTMVELPDGYISQIICKCTEILLLQPCLLELHGPVNVVGDIHGQFSDLLRMFEMGGFPEDTNYLFLGDYVDRANQGVEVLVMLMCYKVKHPETFFLLRGNHECASLTRIYGFYDECRKRYSVKLWREFTELFNSLPLAALIDNKIFCVHGGISPEMEDLGDILNIQRPQHVPEEGIICDLLWADPDSYVSGWADNPRGVSYTFGDDVIANFCDKHDIDLIVRAHQVVEDGYEFQADRLLVTVFSAPNYCGEFDNAGAMMVVKKDLLCSFKVLRPASHKARMQHGANQGLDLDHQQAQEASNNPQQPEGTG